MEPDPKDPLAPIERRGQKHKQPEVVLIGCVGGCDNKMSLDNEGRCPPSWDQLQITGRYRCLECTRALKGVQSIAQSTPTVDELPRDSIGALKKLPEPQKMHEKPGL